LPLYLQEILNKKSSKKAKVTKGDEEAPSDDKKTPVG